MAKMPAKIRLCGLKVATLLTCAMLEMALVS